MVLALVLTAGCGGDAGGSPASQPPAPSTADTGTAPCVPASELCNGADDDCDGLIDDDDPDAAGSTWYADLDGDGWGDPAAPVIACVATGHVLDGTDCDDASALLTPADEDADGLSSCAGDCDDADPTVWPGAPETCLANLDCDPASRLAFGPPLPLATRIDGMSLGDLDADGDLDLATAGISDDDVAWHANDGSGLFGPELLVLDDSGYRGPWDIAVGDQDADGDPDLVVGLMDGDSISWVENLAGPWGPEQLLSDEFGDPRAITLADLDADGDHDILFENGGSPDWPGDDLHRLVWLEQDGFGPGTLRAIGVTGAGDSALAVADFDADGDLDAAGSSFGDDRVMWFPNLGGGAAFDPPTMLPGAPDGPVSLAAADFDLDGATDLAVASFYDDTVAWYRNLGAGVFAAPIVVSASVTEPIAVAAADLDLDGDVDLVASSSEGHEFVWFDNRGGALAAGAPVGVGATGAGMLRIADVTGDGFPDVLGYAHTDDVLYVYPTDCR